MKGASRQLRRLDFDQPPLAIAEASVFISTRDDVESTHIPLMRRKSDRALIKVNSIATTSLQTYNRAGRQFRQPTAVSALVFNADFPFNAGFPMVKLMFHAFVAASIFLGATFARAEDGNSSLGQKLAQEWCAKCHAIGLYGDSPLQIAPPFRDLHQRYNVEDLAESFAEGIMVGHPTMPVYRFDPDQIQNLIAYLKTLER
jgi:cytochrome c